MSRINTNVNSLIAQAALKKNNDATSTALQRLSTGLQINSGADDPAGLIASEGLKQEQAGITTAISNAQRAGNVIGTAEGGLNEISGLLNQLQGLVGQAANSGALSSDEVAANQLQVDTVLSTINRIAGSTNFNGQKLLNGDLAYTTSGTPSISSLQINSALLPANAATNIVIGVTQSAQTATLGYTGGTLGAANNVTLQITGVAGTQQISVAGGSTVQNIASAVNNIKASTGVSASISSNGTDLRFDSTDYGSKQFVKLQTVSGSFNPTAATANGRDAIVTVNGARAQVEGLNVSLANSSFDLSFKLGSTINTNSGTTSFYITGGGAHFALGSRVDENTKASIGINAVTTGNLGDSLTGYLSTLASGQANQLSSANLTTAQNIINESVKQVSTLRGRLGAFQKFTIGSTVNNLNVAYENASAAQSAIADTDFAATTAALTRAQILSQAATTVLSQANTNPQNALALLK